MGGVLNSGRRVCTEDGADPTRPLPPHRAGAGERRHPAEGRPLLERGDRGDPAAAGGSMGQRDEGRGAAQGRPRSLLRETEGNRHQRGDGEGRPTSQS